MRILIPAVQSFAQLSGVQRHALMLVRSLLSQPDVTGVDLIVAPWQIDQFQSVTNSAGDVKLHIATMKRDATNRNAWYLLRLPEFIKRLQPDIVHLSYPVPVRRASIDQPTVATLHDLYPYDIPENFGFPKVIFNRAILQQCLKNVDAVTCVSNATLDRMRSFVKPAICGRALRVFNSVEPCNACSDSSPIPSWQGEPFFLSVAQHRKNKNIPLLLNVFFQLRTLQQIPANTKLLIVGIKGPETPLLHKHVVELGLSDNVLFLEGISEPELQWCYQHCKLLAAPSSIEGFGLPVAEALLAGCRVVCSDIPAFQEIASDRCTFFSLLGTPRDNLREAIVSSLRLPKPAPVSLPQFAAEVVGAQYVELYHRLLMDKGRSTSRVRKAYSNATSRIDMQGAAHRSLGRHVEG